MRSPASYQTGTNRASVKKVHARAKPTAVSSILNRTMLTKAEALASSELMVFHIQFIPELCRICDVALWINPLIELLWFCYKKGRICFRKRRKTSNLIAGLMLVGMLL